MIGGLLVDVLVVAAVAAFGWAGLQLGALASLQRAVASIVAFVLAALLREPAGATVEGLIGTSEDFSRLVGMLAIGVGGYLAATRVFDGWRARRQGDADDERRMPGRDDGIDSPAIAMVAGGVLGLAWSVLFVALLVLLPADSAIARAAASSYTGGALIAEEDGLRWFSEGFPHYTQTLPKGEDGVVVGEQRSLPMHGDVEPEPAGQDADTMLRVINRVRRARAVPVLAFNPDLAAVAQRHASALASDKSLAYTSPGGGDLEARARAALGEAAGAFTEDVGVEVAWAHSPANAATGMLDDARGGDLLRDGTWSEVGIGVADAGWFNGRVYVVLLVAPLDEDETAMQEQSGAAGAVAGVGSDGLPDDVDAGLPLGETG